MCFGDGPFVVGGWGEVAEHFAFLLGSGVFLVGLDFGGDCSFEVLEG